MGLFGTKLQEQILDSILPQAAKDEIQADRLPHIVTNSLFLRNGEYCCFIDKAILNTHVKRRMTQHFGSSAPGLFKGSRVNSGMSRPVEYDETQQQKGILYITNKRVIFQAQKNAFDKQHRYLSTIEPYSNAVILQYGKQTYEMIIPDGVLIDKILKLVVK